LEAIFDRQLKNACPVAKESRVLVDLTNAGENYELKPKMTSQQNNVVVYKLTQSKEPLDIRMSWNQDSFQYRKNVLLYFIISI
jgi:phosphatidylinositol glycan class T